MGMFAFTFGMALPRQLAMLGAAVAIPYDYFMVPGGEVKRVDPAPAYLRWVLRAPAVGRCAGDHAGQRYAASLQCSQRGIFVFVFQALYDNTVAPEGLQSGVRLLLKDEVSDRYWGSSFDFAKAEARVELHGH